MTTFLVILGFIIGMAAIFALLGAFESKKIHYYAAVGAVSGLDPATNNLGEPALQQVEFNLTLGVKSRNPFSSECVEPGANVTVTYLGVQIASGSTGAQACAAGFKPEQMVHLPVVARGRGTTERLLRSALESLAADVRRGAAVFDVSLRIPATPGDDAKLVVCRGRRVSGGGAAGALLAPCEEPQKLDRNLVVYGKTKY
jgi:hypothetical protein